MEEKKLWTGRVGEAERQGVREKCTMGLYGKCTKNFLCTILCFIKILLECLGDTVG